MAAKLTNNQVLLNAYIKQEYVETPEYEDREDDFFEFFAASQVLKDYALSDEEIENGLCGGSLDGGCDAIYLFADGILQDENVSAFDTPKKDVPIELCIIQAKNSATFGEDTIMKWKTICENLFNMETDFDSLQDRYNKFYVIYAVFAKILTKDKISIKDVASVNLSLFSEELIIDTAGEVFNIYMQLGGNDKTAKGPDFIASLKDHLKQIFVKTTEADHAGSI